MRRQSIQIELSPGRLAVRAAAAQATLELDEALWEQAWGEELRPLDGPLEAALAELKVTGGCAALVYHSPTAVAEVFSYPVRQAPAREAAALALADALGRPLDEATWALRVLVKAAKPTPHTVILAAGDHIESAEALNGWVERCGLRLASAAPYDARALSGVASMILGARELGARAVLRIDEGGGAFGAGSGGRLSFVRCVGIGIGHFVEALTRPIRMAVGEAPIILTRDQAREMLLRVGIPGPHEIVDEARGITGAHILPLIQPALQRLLVDVKQSLRFGLEESDREALEIELVGPGADVPGLARTLSEAVDRPAARGLEPRRRRAERPLSALAPSAKERIGMRRATVAMRVGAIVALGYLGEGLYASHAEKQAALEQMSLIEQEAEQAQRLLTLAAERDALARALDGADARLEASFGRRADWLAVLREIASITPEGVRYTELEAKYESGIPVASLHGVAWLDADDANAGGGPIMSCLDALRASPLVESVELGEAQRSEIEGRAARRFVVKASFVGGASWEHPESEAAP